MSKHHQKKSSKPSFRLGEQATPERRRQNGGIASEIIARDYSGNVFIERHKARIECMLDYYLAKQWLSPAQHAAALKYREHYLRVHFGAHSKIFNDALRNLMSGHRDPDAPLIAFIGSIEQLEKAEEKLSSAQREVIRRVCGYDQPAGDTRYKLTLQRGLDVLVMFWNIKP